jgi:hypothetical protein
MSRPLLLTYTQFPIEPVTIAGVLKNQLQTDRGAPGISQCRLARLSGASRFEICTYELSDGSLTPEEQARIQAALINEGERLRNIAIEFGQTEPIASPVGTG